MKKVPYFVLLAAELFVGVLFMISLWDSSLYIPLAIAIVSMVGLLTWQIVLFVKTKDVATKKKIMIGIALIMLVPVAIFAVTYFVIAVAAVIAFSSGGI